MTAEETAIDWIQLELVPLPRFEQELSKLVLWWNPTDRKIVGEGAEAIINIVQSAMDEGCLKGSVASGMPEIELTDPLSQPSELAAILAQYFWVIPTPVKSEDVLTVSSENSENIQ